MSRTKKGSKAYVSKRSSDKKSKQSMNRKLRRVNKTKTGEDDLHMTKDEALNPYDLNKSL